MREIGFADRPAFDLKDTSILDRDRYRVIPVLNVYIRDLQTVTFVDQVEQTILKIIQFHIAKLLPCAQSAKMRLLRPPAAPSVQTKDAIYAPCSDRTGSIHAPYYYMVSVGKIQGEGVTQMIKYDRLWETMRRNGISQYKLIKDYGIDKAQLHRIRKNMVVKTIILNYLCSILQCRIEDIMEYVPDEETKQV